jgi:hypothetical protein
MPANVLPVELAFGVNLITFGKDFSSATSVFMILPFFSLTLQQTCNAKGMQSCVGLVGR